MGWAAGSVGAVGITWQTLAVPWDCATCKHLDPSNHHIHPLCTPPVVSTLGQSLNVDKNLSAIANLAPPLKITVTVKASLPSVTSNLISSHLTQSKRPWHVLHRGNRNCPTSTTSFHPVCTSTVTHADLQTPHPPSWW